MNNGEAEDIEPEIRRRLTIPLMTELAEEELKPSITEEQLSRFKEEHRPMIFYFARLEKKLDHVTEWLMLTNRHQRQMEARQLRHDSLRWKLFKWGTVTIVAGALGAFGKKLIDRIPWP